MDTLSLAALGGKRFKNGFRETSPSARCEKRKFGKQRAETGNFSDKNALFVTE
jgi:hypothetical protein